MKRVISLLLLLSLLVSMAVPASAAQTNPFLDVEPGRFYYTPVLWAVEQGITKGVSADRFDVDGACTRGHVITFLWRAAGCPESTLTQSPYNDTPASAFYYKAVLWALEQGILTKTASFGPHVLTTRGEFVRMLYLAEGSPAHGVYNPFQDVRLNSPYYHAILWAYEADVTNGVSADRFAPADNCTRAQIVTFIWRYYANRSQEPSTPDLPAEPEDPDAPLPDRIDAAQYGLSPDNNGLTNSRILQELVNRMSITGGTIHIPAGVYRFGELSRQTTGSHCVRMQSNVSITGDGEATVLKPTGVSPQGMDMFYFNDYVDLGTANYLENCNFSDFVIDASDTSCQRYTTAGKGFMFKLFRNCHWNNVTVMYTDGTGFGVDSPIDCSMTDCVAIGCGKAATTSQQGASGFGIGFGNSNDESCQIINCAAYDNKKFGFFFEHQKRFSNRYPSTEAAGFTVQNCYAAGNLYNYGGLVAVDLTFTGCVSENALEHGYRLENCVRCTVTDCTSANEGDTAFVLLQSDFDWSPYPVQGNRIQNCTSQGSRYGVKVMSYGSSEPMTDNAVTDCTFYAPAAYVAYTYGTMAGLTMTGNTSDCLETAFQAQIDYFVEYRNSWNLEPDPYYLHQAS